MWEDYRMLMASVGFIRGFSEFKKLMIYVDLNDKISKTCGFFDII